MSLVDIFAFLERQSFFRRLQRGYKGHLFVQEYTDGLVTFTFDTSFEDRLLLRPQHHLTTLTELLQGLEQSGVGVKFQEIQHYKNMKENIYELIIKDEA